MAQKEKREKRKKINETLNIKAMMIIFSVSLKIFR